jgi:DNA-binding NarL/FixJ family response regulator
MNNVQAGQTYKKKSEPMKIFLVEDSAVVRERLVAMVSELRGAEIVGYAEDARRATEYIVAFQPDVMILDIQLSGGSGIEVLREVKRMQPAPVVIMLTNYATPEYRLACQQAGAELFLDKSFEADQLVDILKGMIRQLGILPPVIPFARRRRSPRVDQSMVNREITGSSQR